MYVHDYGLYAMVKTAQALAFKSLCLSRTVEHFWKGQESLTKIAKFGPFPRTILYK